MRTKKPKKVTYAFPQDQLREADKALYCLLQIIYNLKLISQAALHHSTTTETGLLASIEDP